MNSLWTKIPFKAQAWIVIVVVVAFFILTPRPTERWQVMVGVIVAIVTVVGMASALVRFISHQDTKRLPSPPTPEDEPLQQPDGSFIPDPIRRIERRRISRKKGGE